MVATTVATNGCHQLLQRISTSPPFSLIHVVISTALHARRRFFTAYASDAKSHDCFVVEHAFIDID
jgi:hypothetical protein